MKSHSRKIIFLLVLGIAAGLALPGDAQNAKKKRQQKYHSFVEDFANEQQADFDEFQKSITAEFADFVSNPWKAFDEKKPVPKPVEPPVPPVTVPEEDRDKPVEDKPVVIKEVVKPLKPQPKPQPVEPVKPVPQPQPTYVNFTFYGTPAKVRLDAKKLPRLTQVDERNVADAIRSLAAIPELDNTLQDCLDLRNNHHLSDWAYLNMLKLLSQAAFPSSPNDATLLTSYLFMKSGYKMRMASDGAGTLLMLYGSDHIIFGSPYYTLSGTYYYPFGKAPSRIYICQASFPGEKPLSLLVTEKQEFAENLSEPRTIKSRSFSDFEATTRVNKNLIDFYDTYPTSMLGGDMMTRWAMYANTPMDPNVAELFYPKWREKFASMSKLQAVERILNWVQTGLVYEYDDKVWGQDRAFFPEESLYYPYCDCEDRSILFTRLVRDLVGLDCLLIYYPGHLAAAVAFNDPEVKGDYLTVGSQRFVVADPTYIGARLGLTMPGMDNGQAKVIILK